MRTGHLRNLNHEVRKKNAKNPHIIVCCSLRVCSLHDLWLCGDWMAVCVSHQEKLARSIVFILRTCCILHKTPMHVFWHN